MASITRFYVTFQTDPLKISIRAINRCDDFPPSYDGGKKRNEFAFSLQEKLRKYNKSANFTSLFFFPRVARDLPISLLSPRIKLRD